MQKRPAIMIEFAKSESKGKCRLSDQTTAGKARPPSKAGCGVRDEYRPIETVGCVPTCWLTSCLPHPREWQEQLGTFLNYFMLVPGYSTEDVHDTDLGLPEHCQEFMQGMWRADVKRTVARAAEPWRQLYLCPQKRQER